MIRNIFSDNKIVADDFIFNTSDDKKYANLRSLYLNVSGISKLNNTTHFLNPSFFGKGFAFKAENIKYRLNIDEHLQATN